MKSKFAMPRRCREGLRARFLAARSGAVAAATAMAALALSPIALQAVAGAAYASGTDAPFGGTAAALPGTVQAANYDTGGQGVAYNVTSVNGTANSYRSDGVDLEVTSDTGGGYDIGWTSAGQWFNYTVDASSAGTYSVSIRVAAPGAVSDAFHIANTSGTNLSGPVGVPATGGWQTWTTVTTSVTLPAGQQTLVIDQDSAGWNIHQLTFATTSSYGPPPATGGSLPSDVYVFNTGMAQSTIQSDINSLYTQQQTNQFGTQRYALLFEPGTYGSSSDPLVVNVGFYEEIAGLGLTPASTVINGVVNSYNQCSGTNCQALDNFWRSVMNLTINVNTSTLSGCYNNGDDFWAVSQAAPLRQVQVNGNLTLSDFCENPGYASGGYIGNSVFSGGSVSNDSQQQFIVRNSNIDSWSNGVWNQVFCGDNGAPATNFNVSGGVYTNVGSCGNTEEEPYLYTDSSGNYNVFVPSLQTNSNGPNWTGGSPTGTTLPWSDFYVATPSSTTDQINAALANGDDLILTPGVYEWGATINVPDANTKIIGLGFPTVVPTNGNITMTVADVPGVNISDVIFDAGPVNSPVLLQVGTQGSTQNYSSDPVTLDDVFARIGGATAGMATTAFIDNSNYSIIDDMWSWRADHGAGATWTGNPSANGLIVNGNNVSAYGLAVEHYQGYEVEWNGQNGKVIFFQNENPYDPPSQSAWEVSSSQLGYPAFYIPNSVTSFNGYGMGSYCYFDQGVDIHNSMAFQAPNTAGVVFHGLFTVFLNGSGGIDSVINGVGAPVASGSMTSYVTSYS
ncbi:MAG TPA: carbohydrate-binding protein [Acidimicrobiales bacterium]|nr:carbohydrate-binding protein [Acidimicrobiales bacterium]